MNIPICHLLILVGLDNPIGMELKSITDDSITATSMEGNTFQPSSARLHLNIAGGGWCAKKSLHDVPQYLQVDLDRSWALIAVATQGIESIQSWVSEYYLSTTFDHKVWIFVHDFTGKKVRNYFNIERFQRILPKKYIGETQLALFYRTYFLKETDHVSYRVPRLTYHYSINT